MGEVIGTKQLARVLGISDRRVRDLSADGTIPKIGRGRFDLVDAVSSYCAHLRDTASGRGGEDAVVNLTAERALLAQEQRVGQQIKNAAARGDLVDRSEVTSGWAEILRRVRSRLLAVPSRVRTRRAHLLPEDIETVDSEIREALEDLSDDRA